MHRVVFSPLLERTVFSCSSTITLTLNSSKASLCQNECPRGSVPLSYSCYPRRPRITLIPGDGVGKEIMEHVKGVLGFMRLPIDLDEFWFSYHDPERNDDVNKIRESIRNNGISLAGHIVPPPEYFPGPSLHLISQLDFFANVTYIRSLKGVNTRHSNVDIVLIREQSEGEYKRIEHAVWSKASGEAVSTLKIITRKNSERIARFAFDYATKYGRKRVTSVHKANIMKLGDGMFLRVCREIAELYPEIEFNDMIIDNTAMQLVSKPQQFDVIVTPNLYGNIIENIGAGLVGGPGVVPGEDWSHDEIMFGMGARHAFHAVKGKDEANPATMLLSTGNMLRQLYFNDHADALKNAVYEVLQEGRNVTKDINGTATASEFVEEVKCKLSRSNLPFA